MSTSATEEKPRREFEAFVGEAVARDGQVRVRSFAANGEQQELSSSETGAGQSVFAAIKKAIGFSTSVARTALEEARQSAVIAKTINTFIVGERNDLSYRLIPEPAEPGWMRVQAIRLIPLANGRFIETGEIGGLVQGEHNLHQGGAWVAKDARVSGNGLIMAGALLNSGEVADDAVLFGPVIFNGLAAGRACLTTDNFQPRRIDGVYLGSARVVDGKLLTRDGDVRVEDIGQGAVVCDTAIFEKIDHLPLSAKAIIGHIDQPNLASHFCQMSPVDRKNAIEMLRNGALPTAAELAQPGVAYRLAKEMPWLLESLGLKMAVETRQARTGGVDRHLDALCEGRASLKGVSLALPAPDSLQPEIAAPAQSRRVMSNLSSPAPM